MVFAPNLHHACRIARFFCHNTRNCCVICPDLPSACSRCLRLPCLPSGCLQSSTGRTTRFALYATDTAYYGPPRGSPAKGKPASRTRIGQSLCPRALSYRGPKNRHPVFMADGCSACCVKPPSEPFQHETALLISFCHSGPSRRHCAPLCAPEDAQTANPPEDPEDLLFYYCLISAALPLPVCR